MKRREFIRNTALGAAGMGIAPVLLNSCQNNSLKRKPNVIVILTDDQDKDHIGAYGGNVLTPNIDRLASEGVLFDRYYVNSPVCTASRHSILTGRYAGRCRRLQKLYPSDQPAFIRWNTFIEDGEKTLAHTMRDNGYNTGIVGKWHLGPDWEYIGGDEKYTDSGVKERVDRGYKIFTDYIKKVSGFDYTESIYGNNMHCIGIPKSMQYHNMEWITKGALDFIDQNRDQPFFLYMATTLPHAPGPVKSLKADPRITAAGMLDKPIDVQPSREDVLHRTQEAGLADETAPVSWLDDGIGAVLNKLDELNISDDTIIVFSSDHQSPGKMSCYEATAVAPALIHWKGQIKPARISNDLVTNVDIAPTILDLCGIQSMNRQKYDGQSLKPLLMSKKSPDRESLYLEVIYSRAVVSDDWKYIALRFPDEIHMKITKENRNEYSQEGKRQPDRYGSDKTYPGYFDNDQLYNLHDDPGEQNNLAYDPAFAGKLKEMKSLLAGYCKDLPHAFGEFKSTDN